MEQNMSQTEEMGVRKEVNEEKETGGGGGRLIWDQFEGGKTNHRTVLKSSFAV